MRPVTMMIGMSSFPATKLDMTSSPGRPGIE